MQKGNPTPADLKKFSLQMATALTVLTGIQFLGHKPSCILFYWAAAIFLLGVGLPSFIKPFYFIFRTLAFVIEWIGTRMIMCVIFYFVLTPLGLAMKLWGKDPLDRKIEKDKPSYWKEKARCAFNPLDYERQF